MASAAKTTLSLLWLVATIIGSTAFVPLTRHAVAVTRPLASSARSRTAPMHMGLLKVGAVDTIGGGVFELRGTRQS